MLIVGWCLFCQNGKELFNFNIIYVMFTYLWNEWELGRAKRWFSNVIV